MRVSIIIPVRDENDIYLKECIDKLKEQDYLDYEIIIVPDSICPGFPSVKRNYAVSKATGDILAFIDSDAYPASKYWISNAVYYFEKYSHIGAVGGPQLTPPQDSFFQQISGYTLSSVICSGNFSNRYKPLKEEIIYVDELPSANLFVRRNLFENFDESLLTGEDAKLCFQIRKKGYSIICSNSVAVFHHRRKNLWQHIKQINQYAEDKAKVLKDLRLFKLVYFIPTLFTLFVLFGYLISSSFYFAAMSIYLSIVLANGVKYGIKNSGFIFIYIVFTHISYGLGFLRGLIR